MRKEANLDLISVSQGQVDGTRNAKHEAVTFEIRDFATRQGDGVEV